MSIFIKNREAAKLTGMSQDYIGQLIRSNKISGKKIDGEWLVDQISLFTYVEKLGRKKIGLKNSSAYLKLIRRGKKFLIAFLILLFVLSVFILTAFLFTNDETISVGDNKNQSIDIKENSSDGYVFTSWSDESGQIEISAKSINSGSKK